MATATKRQYSHTADIGVLDGKVITRRMVNGKVRVTGKVQEFLRFLEQLNRGAIT